MSASRRQISWGVWTLWVAGGAWGGMLGAAFWCVGRPVDTMPSVGFLLLEAIWTLGMLVMAAMPGFLQWLIVRRSFPQATWWTLTVYGPIAGLEPGERRRFPRARWWFGVSVIGSLVGLPFISWAAAVADAEPGGPAFAVGAFAALILLGGASAGALQWLAALPWFAASRWAASAGWSLLASSIGWLGAAFLLMVVTRAADAQTAWLYFPLGGAASGAFAAAISGLILVWLSRHAGMNQPSARDPAACHLARRAECRVVERQEMVHWPQENGRERDGRAPVR